MQRLTLLAALLVATFCAHATDGVIEINAAKVAAAGGYPYVINQPGSYRLTSNLTQSDKDTNVINIAAHNVTLDLNGFTISGANVCTLSGTPLAALCTATGNGDGVYSNGSFANTSIVNGVIDGMGHNGILISDGSNPNPAKTQRVDNVRVSNCGVNGIQVSYALITNSGASFNGSSGISAQGGRVDGVVAHNNGSEGVYIAEGVLSSSTAIGNVHDGLSIGGGALIGNVSIRNHRWGFNIATAAFSQNIAYGNTVADHSPGSVISTPPNSNICGSTAC